MATPELQGIHHLKIHVTDPRRSARWYQRVLGYEPTLEFFEGDVLVGYGMSHGNGGTLLTIRLDPEQASKTAGWIYFEMGVPDKPAMEAMSRHLDELGERHGPVVQTPIGWVLPGLHDPDGHEMRFYLSDPQADRLNPRQPRRMHDAGGPEAWSEPRPAIDLTDPDEAHTS